MAPETAPAPPAPAVLGRGPTPQQGSTPSPSQSPVPIVRSGTQADDPPAAPAKDFAARASDLLANQIPRLAQQAERLVLRVLFVASRSDDGSQDDDIRQAAITMRQVSTPSRVEEAAVTNDARSLNEAARVAYFRHNDAQEALGLQSRAFGANPLDPEVVSNLAFLYLKQRPAQAELARQLALHSLTMYDARYPGGRVEDWTTLAIAEALTGRDRESRNAWFVALALAPNPERQCRAAINAYSTYGDRLRGPVEAMLYRVQSTGRAERSPVCEWPPYWTTGRQR